MPGRSKADSDAIQAVAQRLVEPIRAEMDAIPAGDERTKRHRDLAISLMKETDCAYETARRHIAKAFRRLRFDDSETPVWGGQREGAGRPTDETTVRISDDTPLSQIEHMVFYLGWASRHYDVDSEDVFGALAEAGLSEATCTIGEAKRAVRAYARAHNIKKLTPW